MKADAFGSGKVLIVSGDRERVVEGGWVLNQGECVVLRDVAGKVVPGKSAGWIVGSLWHRDVGFVDQVGNEC